MVYKNKRTMDIIYRIRRMFAAVGAISILSCTLLLPSCSGQETLRDGEYTIDVFTTNDVHGRYFDEPYVNGGTKESLLAVNSYMNSQRESLGEDRVVFIDAGDCLQGDNAAYYYNYVDTGTKHLYARMAEYMRYDAIVVGNHDIETGHPVYDRLVRTMDIPFLAANALKEGSGKAYFQEYTILKRQGLRIAVIGFTNPGIKGWLTEDLWRGLDFASLLPYAQQVVDRVIAREKPQVVIVAAHSGTGKGDGSSLENQGLDLLQSLENVDFVICAHDHSPLVRTEGEVTLINAGSHCRKLGHGTVELTVKDGKVVSKKTRGELISIDKNRIDERMKEEFREDYEKVKAFTVRKVGELAMPLVTRESFIGMCDYMNLIHTVCLAGSGAQLSMAAPLTFNGFIKAGDLTFNDLFTIYPYENQLFTVKMTGRQIKDYLECSYDDWIRTISWRGDSVLKIEKKEDPRNGQKHWSFIGRSYNLDSMGGAFYTVDVTRPRGERVEITALADGTPFSMEQEYRVAMTSYRACGGGFLMSEGAGIDTSDPDSYIVERHPDIRSLVYDYFSGHVDMNGKITPVCSEELSREKVIGKWSFVPENIAGPALKRDFGRLFPKRK